MKTTFGLRGAIVPPGPFKGKAEAFVFQGFAIEIADGVITIGFDDRSLEEQARAIARQHLAWFSAAHGVRHVADLNQSWECKPDGSSIIGVSVSDNVRVQDDVYVRKATIQGGAHIVTSSYDTAVLSTYSALTEKSLRNDALRDALTYFNDEKLPASPRSVFSSWCCCYSHLASVPFTFLNTTAQVGHTRQRPRSVAQ